MNDDRFEEWVQRAAADYNRPAGDVPREEMWARIRAARAAGVRVSPESGIRVLPMRRRAPRWLLAGLAAAAVLVIGVAIGRFTAPDTASSPTVASLPATPPGPRPKPDERAIASDPTTVIATTDDTGAGGSPSIATPSPRSAGTPRLATGERAQPSPAPGNGASGAYAAVTAQHLASAEALLTSYRADAVDGRVDAQMSAWARDLLTTTRLLMDSPAAQGAQRRRLLQDLELLLVQIVQLNPDAAEDERALVERSIDREHMMMRLRAATPVGAASGT